MKLGDLLVAAKLVTAEQITEALSHQARSGKRLGEVLVETGAISSETLESFLRRVPRQPDSIEATGVGLDTLLGLMMKQILMNRLETAPQISDSLALPAHIVEELVFTAQSRRLLSALGQRDGLIRYALEDAGERWAHQELQQSQYVGPAPVTLENFIELVRLQKITNVVVTAEKIKKSFGDLAVEESFIEKIGPALNSGRATLLYGPPGNGKTSFARCFADIFNDVVYVPYAVLVGGQIMRVYDKSIHFAADPHVSAPSLFRSDESDARWIPCRRPFVVAGGELTLEMLDLQYNATSKFYEAPLHVKALGGVFVIDDFGRQIVSPTNLLNRWIVPLENKIDYLKLHTGLSFSIPFEEMLIFSTNLEPEDLMDPAFLRRLPYKLEVGAPTLERYRRVFDIVCRQENLALTDDIFDVIVRKVTKEKGLDLAAYQPRFIVDQIAATCRFMGQPIHFEPRFIDYAIENLRVAKH